MNILVLQETDWLTRGPHTQHHIFENLSENPSISITVLDYDIDKLNKFRSLFIPKQVFRNIHRVLDDSNITIIRTAHLQIPFLRRITSLITNFFEILRIFKKNKPDIIVGFSITNGLIGLILAKLFKIPFLFFYIDILHEIVPIQYVKKLARIIARFTLKRSDKVLVHTNIQYKYLINEGITGADIEVSPDGISLENTIVDKNIYNLLKSKYFIQDDDFVIFFMGHLYEFAGLKEIIDHYNSKVKTGNLNLKFLILGDGGIYNSLRNYIEKIEADWVILAGRVPYNEIKEYIELTDLCLLSFAINDITKEILPIKILEYMAMKKPVLTNSLPGVVHELKKDSDLIFAENQNELIEMIEDLIPQKENLKKIGQKGYELVKKKYTWKKIITDFKKNIITLIEKKRI
ncbi:MAG: glycosyltransferase [Promethearchaeota archaeon]|jgi:glycosyltransferase involved in cell wall biosynthesis